MGDEIQTVINVVYPDTPPFNVQAGVYFETGRKPGRGVSPVILKTWAEIKIPGFKNLRETEQKSRLFLINRAIKKKGIGTINVFGEIEMKLMDGVYNWYETMTPEERLTMPGIEQIIDAFSGIQLIDSTSIQYF